MTIKQFIDKHGIWMEATQELATESADGRWMCELRYQSAKDAPIKAFPCWGPHEEARSGAPPIEHVLGRLAGDARTVLQIGTFEEWAAELGVNPDSRTEERMYIEVRRQTQRLKDWLGSRAFRELLETTDEEEPA